MFNRLQLSDTTDESSNILVFQVNGQEEEVVSVSLYNI